MGGATKITQSKPVWIASQVQGIWLSKHQGSELNACVPCSSSVDEACCLIRATLLRLRAHGVVSWLGGLVKLGLAAWVSYDVELVGLVSEEGHLIVVWSARERIENRRLEGKGVTQAILAIGRSAVSWQRVTARQRGCHRPRCVTAQVAQKLEKKKDGTFPVWRPPISPASKAQARDWLGSLG
ncbi:hypothetical protein GQ53DRAFT_77474 [Thozetella sp. PMI_491]|nr:hypothetical protein GQ53DRAFT_77474 [Thozetella sp. PMI_491]